MALQPEGLSCAHITLSLLCQPSWSCGLTLIFFSAPITVADASVLERGSMDISEMQRSITNLPVEKLHDMTFVFAD